MTTKDRLNRYGPARVYAKNFNWYINDTPFKDGIKVNQAGDVV